jgi:hypothetical protein
VANKSGSAHGTVEHLGQALKQQAVWFSFRDVASTWADDSANQGVRETATLTMSSFLDFAGTERER